MKVSHTETLSDGTIIVHYEQPLTEQELNDTVMDLVEDGKSGESVKPWERTDGLA